jgi:hypothetical protein
MKDERCMAGAGIPMRAQADILHSEFFLLPRRLALLPGLNRAL